MLGKNWFLGMQLELSQGYHMITEHTLALRSDPERLTKHYSNWHISDRPLSFD
jgi:hypothetical protein